MRARSSLPKEDPTRSIHTLSLKRTPPEAFHTSRSAFPNIPKGTKSPALSKRIHAPRRSPSPAGSSLAPPLWQLLVSTVATSLGAIV